ncbi:prostatic spermine-binding protein-like [Anthonomus grandis grandis]|uniref:prostatic spermine-binding protein-like n=1 Tax=Anthonomus grandis grandis TaxID=2921223 RepID=UPI0021664884|nr:prostatic spermine-binding protein-like [Anthonomus grandis grandis]
MRDFIGNPFETEFENDAEEDELEMIDGNRLLETIPNLFGPSPNDSFESEGDNFNQTDNDDDDDDQLDEHDEYLPDEDDIEEDHYDFDENSDPDFDYEETVDLDSDLSYMVESDIDSENSDYFTFPDTDLNPEARLIPLHFKPICEQASTSDNPETNTLHNIIEESEQEFRNE